MTATDSPRQDLRRKPALEAQRGNVGVEDNAPHGRSGEICVTHRGNMSQEGVQLLVRVEDALLRQISGRTDRAHTLAPRLLINRLGTAIRRDCCVVRPVRGHHHPRWLGPFQYHTHTGTTAVRCEPADAGTQRAGVAITAGRSTRRSNVCPGPCPRNCPIPHDTFWHHGQHNHAACDPASHFSTLRIGQQCRHGIPGCRVGRPGWRIRW